MWEQGSKKGALGRERKTDRDLRIIEIRKTGMGKKKEEQDLYGV